MEFTTPLSYNPAYRPSAPTFQRKARNARPNKASQNKKKQARNAPNHPRNPRDSAVIRAPVALTKINRTGVPQMSRLSNGDLVVSHREFLRDIPGSSGFNVSKLAVNPGLSEAFPWLSQMATLYESYCFEKLDFEFQTMSPTTESGSVMMAIDYDASDPAPIDKQQMASYRGYARSAPWENFKQISRREDLSKRKTSYVRNGGLNANEDVKLYDVGNLFVATQGQTTPANSVGELYASYRVKLMTPQLNNPALGNSKSSSFTDASGQPAVTVPGSNAPLSISGSLPGVLTITASSAYQCLLAGLLLGTSTALTLGGTAAITETVNVTNTAGTNTSVNAEVSFLAGQTLTITSGGTPTAIDLRLGQYNNALA